MGTTLFISVYTVSKVRRKKMMIKKRERKNNISGKLEHLKRERRTLSCLNLHLNSKRYHYYPAAIVDTTKRSAPSKINAIFSFTLWLKFELKLRKMLMV